MKKEYLLPGYNWFLHQDPETGWYIKLSQSSEDPNPPKVLNFVHPKSACEGRNCSIHNNPSLHPLAMEPLVFREDDAATLRMCAHQLLHPDHDDLEYRKSVGDYEHYAHHNCDGCCGIDKEYRN